MGISALDEANRRSAASMNGVGNPNWANDPESIAINLGLAGYQPGYDSNDKGSYERNFNNLLNNLSPDQLIKRYAQGNTAQYGTNLDRANYQAYNSFKSLIGRDPTSNELAQAIPAFQGGPQIGNAWLAQYAESQKNNPANLAAGAGKYKDQVNQLFQSQLGRDATADEVTHFGSLLGTGNVDAYQLQDFLRGTTEYQQAADTKFRGGLADELQGYDTKFFDKAKENVINRFGSTGGLQNRSSALDFALTDLMGQIADKRGEYLANLSSSQYGGNKDLALGNYKSAMDQYLQSQGQTTGRTQQLQDYYQGRSDNVSDYNRQMQDYLNYNSGGMNRSRAMGAAGGALQGAGAGAAFGPWGAAAGGVLGGAYGYYNS